MAGSEGTVLLVEDDDSMREAIERLLNAAGFRCQAHASAEALLARGLDEGFAGVISDLRLPGMSGLALLAALRERGVSLPFILITAHDAPGLGDKAVQCGAAAYLAKPFRGTTLLDALRAVIQHPRRALTGDA
jgi:two-component system C4-dicarboxylate transport response regulator DctD